MKIKGFRVKKNNSFKYVPRYSPKTDGVGPYRFDSKFSKYRETPVPYDMRGQWKTARTEGRTKANREINKRLVIITAVLILIVLWIFDFDLSIFFKR